MDTNERIKQLINKKQNVLLTGGAGTGKSYTTNRIIAYLRNKGIPTGITASTGFASTHISGSTIHSFIGMKTATSIDEIESVIGSLNLKKIALIKEKKVLIIDEISMISSFQLDLISMILQKVKGNEAPFGGMQMILVGDFFQLPPVVRREWTKDGLHWAFNSEEFKRAEFKVVNLTKVYRQEDNKFSSLLNEARLGTLSDNSTLTLWDRQIKKHEVSISLFATNAMADDFNLSELARIDAPYEQFKGAVTFKEDEFTEKEQSKHFYTLKNSIPVPYELEVKSGAKIMLRDNDLEGRYVNGTFGTYIKLVGHISLDVEKYLELVCDLIMLGFKEEIDYTIISDKFGNETDIEFNEDKIESITEDLKSYRNCYSQISTMPKMKIKLNNNSIIYLPKKKWEFSINQNLDEHGKREMDAFVSQYPIRLAYGITIHKSQGATLDSVFINFKDVYQYGQGYVALSRAKNIDNLYLRNFDSRKIRVDPDVLKFYNELGIEL